MILVDSVSLHKSYTSLSFSRNLQWIVFSFCLILYHNDFITTILLDCCFLFLESSFEFRYQVEKQKLVSVVRNWYILTKKLYINKFTINTNIKEQCILLWTKIRSENRNFALVYVHLLLKLIMCEFECVH